MSNETLSSLSTRIKQQRKKQLWTLEHLANLSGVSRSMLSQIERGKANPTLAVTCKIAEAFNISIAELIEEPWTQPLIEVVKGDNKNSILRDDQSAFIQVLTPIHSAENIEFYLVKLPVNGELNSHPHMRGTREMITVQSGDITVISGSDSKHLTTGDNAYYQADQDHRIINNWDQEAVIYMITSFDNASNTN
ncbi:XRE family transcriptional regulator [Cocleimonas sp. KMM 6892]|uniref:helix-turn-helix domain-containing protein n=1 Tax=unclassified Cocleimonas TaxID=2639732 RepID=UPI002DB6A1D2|nr:MULTISPECIES: XRE family transcriptional regulator [unclassified Cocleimonas]MEB8431794.1 XRE family transcriptional regulator [Cocleimonas sp. KMM 6892]MEC4715120.1 XRE family transcriptional regulator [Cocleimonas sp. KMM 6895]MEC4744066.1 XRE family transcriptional regulator [Cocleimonas sp. KMM 6896]